jgi:FtsP/CotA-like multicopper oxidase with cupredoxin domain
MRRWRIGALCGVACGLIVQGYIVRSQNVPLKRLSLQGLKLNLKEVPASNPEFENPPEVHSSGGELSTTLTVQYTDPTMTAIGSDPRDAMLRLRSYSGKLVGPTLRARPGDTLRIKLVNNLPPEQPENCADIEECKDPAPVPPSPLVNAIRKGDEAKVRQMAAKAEPDAGMLHDMNKPHGFNTTNIHTHGLHVSPSGKSDNVFVEVKPGEHFDYEIKIPSDHAAGTFWYHAHKHGSVAMQLGGGMQGMIIVEGGMDQQPEIKAARERIFVFQQLSYLHNKKSGYNELECFDKSFGPGRRPWACMTKNLGRRTTINGLKQPVIHMRPGAVERWRFVHGGIRESLHLRWLGPVRRDASLTDARAFYALAYDGIATGTITEEAVVGLEPGYRADVLVKAPDDPAQAGTYFLTDEPSANGLFGEPEDRKILARVEVGGAPQIMNLPAPGDLAQYKQTRPIPSTEVTGYQSAMYRIDFRGDRKFQINLQSYGNHVRQLKLGDVEEWELVAAPSPTGLSPTGEPTDPLYIAHPFHIHVNPFQIVAVIPDPFWKDENPNKPNANGAPHPGDPYIEGLLAKHKNEVWKDTLLMLPRNTYIIRTRYENFTGKFVQHCHILDHEDQGMMENIEIISPGMIGHSR